MKSTSRSIHRKKLEKLTINQIGAVKDSGLITNLSSYSLDLSEKLVLSRGLNFAYPSKSDDVAIKSEFESCFYRLQKDVDATKHNEFSNGLGDLAYQYCNARTPLMSKLESSAIRRLRNNKDIVISKPDKGSGVVVMDRANYVDKMMKIFRR